jgi:molecular chaperone HtpG
MIREAGQEAPPSERIFELNPQHALVKSVRGFVERGDPEATEWIELLYDQALVAEGAPVEDPAGFARRMTALLTRAASR